MCTQFPPEKTSARNPRCTLVVRPSIHGVRRTPFMDGLTPTPNPLPQGGGGFKAGLRPAAPKGGNASLAPFHPPPEKTSACSSRR